MKRIVMGCTVAVLVALSPRTEARPPSPLTVAPPIIPALTEEIVGEFGLASWYGEEFQGNPTASGEAYDMNGLTAAHRSLPLGTTIKVTNLKNNRSLIVRVNDRGPFISSRILDVSMAAAKKLGFLGAGVAYVRSEIVSFPKGYTRN
jgi:rare lipoprotein A (peptidoglycan hydrolase)